MSALGNQSQSTRSLLTEAVKTDEILHYLNTLYVDCMSKNTPELDNISELTAHRLAQIVKRYDTITKLN